LVQVRDSYIASSIALDCCGNPPGVITQACRTAAPKDPPLGGFFDVKIAAMSLANRIFWTGVALFVPIVVLLYIDIVHGITQELWLLDNAYHFSGGVFAGLVGAWWGLMLTREAKLWHALAGAIILGVAVEILQYLTGTGLSPYLSFPVDATKDMIFDALGGLGAWWLIRKLDR
jgi:hypothetical protein